jgi:hypothetical protein
MKLLKKRRGYKQVDELFNNSLIPFLVIKIKYPRNGKP